MSGRERDVKKVMKVTGASYDEANSELIRRHQIGQIKAYMITVKATPVLLTDQPKRCVRCLAPLHGKCDR